MFIEPMLAHKVPDDFDPEPGEWVVEEKYDGHRIIVEIGDQKEAPLKHGHNGDLFSSKPPTSVTAWSRYGRNRTLPTHIREVLGRFPKIVIDGELYVPGGKSSTVVEKTRDQDLVYVIFDVLVLKDKVTTDLNYDARRMLLEEIFRRKEIVGGNAVVLAGSFPINNRKELFRYRDAIWKQGGEGLILKRRNSAYLVGKRSKNILKLKKLETELTTLIGFEAGTSQKINRGPFAKVWVRADDGHEYTVKTLSDEELEKFETQWKEARNRAYEKRKTQPTDPNKDHPALGRKLWVEYHEKNANGSRREPRWDRWEDE